MAFDNFGRKHRNILNDQNKDNKERGNTSLKTRNTSEDKEEGSTSLLQIGVVFLAIVSFFTTANGMRTYIFINDDVIAYAASAAIQSILLALSMHLPGYLKGIRKQSDLNGFAKFFLYIAALLLTGVILFCSSWFSYVYIADIIHQDSWGTDSELLVQQTYRTELYDARDYAHTYRTYLEESLGEKILLLEIQARALSDDNISDIIDWKVERRNYVENAGATTASYMAPVIGVMEDALESGASHDKRDLAVRAVADAKENISVRMETIQQNLNTLNNNITNYNNQIESLTRRINNATEDTDVSALSDAINNYTELIKDLSEQQVNLQTESIQLDDALFRLSTYESVLGLDSATSAISIRTSLIELQSEFFQQEPDEERMLEIAESIFYNLRSASGTATEEGTLTSANSLTYMNLLVQMNQLLRNLIDYTDVKEIESDLDDFIAGLRSTNMTADPEFDNTPSEPDETPSESNATEPDSDDETLGSDNTPMEPGDETPESDDIPVESGDETPESDNTPVGSGDEISETNAPLESGGETQEANDTPKKPDATENDKDSWKKEWGEKLEALKAQISALPAYSESEEASGNTIGVLSESQLDILRNYDRNNSSKELDDMIRRYIASHNAIYEGIIYLQSPYRSLAIFALILAFSFDLAGFVFGVVIQGRSPKQKGSNQFSLSPSASSVNGNRRTEWSVLESLNQYIVLTGDYESKDETYYYKVFRNGILEQWIVQDKSPYPKGIYIQDIEDPTKGMSVNGTTQELLFAGQADQPSDGIYEDCQLIFDEGGLIMIQGSGDEEQRHFVASINEYVPVHSYNPHKGENQTIPAKQLAKDEIHVQTAVVALTAKGTRVSAIYIIEK